MQVPLIILSLFTLNLTALSKSYCRPLPSTQVIKNCGNSKDVFQLETVELNPVHPRRNATNYVRVVGKVTDTIDEGTKFNVTIIHDGTKYFDNNKDLCRMLDEYEALHRCPIEPTELDFTTSIILGDFIPTGKYIIKAVGFTPEKQVFKVKLRANLE